MDAKEKFTVKITDRGIEIISTAEGKENRMNFTAGEALMLLDILEHEAPKLKQIAQESSPLPIRIEF
jgi:hypothetical protein